MVAGGEGRRRRPQPPARIAARRKAPQGRAITAQGNALVVVHNSRAGSGRVAWPTLVWPCFNAKGVAAQSPGLPRARRSRNRGYPGSKAPHTEPTPTGLQRRSRHDLGRNSNKCCPKPGCLLVYNNKGAALGKGPGNQGKPCKGALNATHPSTALSGRSLKFPIVGRTVLQCLPAKSSPLNAVAAGQ